MGMAAMLVMWPRPFEQLFCPKGPGGCIWNLVAIGPVVSEEKSFENVDGRRTDDGASSGELKKKQKQEGQEALNRSPEYTDQKSNI